MEYSVFISFHYSNFPLFRVHDVAENVTKNYMISINYITFEMLG